MDKKYIIQKKKIQNVRKNKYELKYGIWVEKTKKNPTQYKCGGFPANAYDMKAILTTHIIITLFYSVSKHTVLFLCRFGIVVTNDDFCLALQFGPINVV